MSALRLYTRRLELIAADARIAAADARRDTQLCELLSAEIPADWPPPLLADHLLQFAIALDKGGSAAVGWWGWYIICTEAERRTLIGSIGGSQPTESGDCVVGYSILSAHWRAGYASEALAVFLRWAVECGSVRRFIGYTYPHLVASVRVLEKNGFLYVGAGADPGTIRFEKSPAPTD